MGFILAGNDLRTYFWLVTRFLMLRSLGILAWFAWRNIKWHICRIMFACRTRPRRSRNTVNHYSWSVFDAAIEHRFGNTFIQIIYLFSCKPRTFTVAVFRSIICTQSHVFGNTWFFNKVSAQKLFDIPSLFFCLFTANFGVGYQKKYSSYSSTYIKRCFMQ